MRGHQREDARRDKKNVGHEKPRDGKGTHLRTTAHQAFYALTNPGNFAHRVGPYGGGKIGSLVPREQVAGECHGQDETEKYASGEPKKLAPSFVRSIDKRL